MISIIILNIVSVFIHIIIFDNSLGMGCQAILCRAFTKPSIGLDSTATQHRLDGSSAVDIYQLGWYMKHL